MQKKLILISIPVCLIILMSLVFTCVYKRDKNKFEPRYWIGVLDYRLNFRDVGQSLNQCLKQDVFHTGKIYRSNRYFSGWSCDKIHNPDKIYSLDFSPQIPHAYYCEQSNGTRLIGFHPNTTFEISDIEKLENWGRPEFKKSMCVFFNAAFQDLIDQKSFLYHCDVGRDRTGAFTAMLTMSLAEQKNYNNEHMLDAVECDYEKTRSLEKEKKGKMKKFLQETGRQGGMSRFIENQCGISPQILEKAADQFFY